MSHSPESSPKKHPVNLQLDPEDYALLTRFAAEDQRSRTNYVLLVLRRHLKERVAKEAATSQ